MKIERELELQQTKEMLARLGKKVDNVDKMDKSGREVQYPIYVSYCGQVLQGGTLPCLCILLQTLVAERYKYLIMYCLLYTSPSPRD